MNNIKKYITLPHLLIILMTTSVQAQESRTDSMPKQWNLETCVKYAIDHNISIKEQQITVEQNKIEKNTAKWSRLPSITGSANEGINWGRSPSPVDNTYRDTENNNLSLGLGANIPLFTGFRIPNQYALSKINFAASLKDLEKAKQDLSIQIAQQYLQVLYNEELLNTNKQQLALSQKQFLRIQKQFNVGKVAKNKMADARATVAQDKSIVIESNNTYQLSLLTMTQLLELPTPENFSLVAPKVKNINEKINLKIPSVYQNALINKPSIKAAQLRLKGTKNSILIAQSAYMPSLTLSGGLNTGYYHIKNFENKSFSNQLDNNLNKSLSLNLSIPIFNRFSTRNNVRKAKLQRTLYDLQLNNSRKTLYKEVQQAYYNAIAAQAKYKSAQVYIDAQEIAFNLMTKKYEYGKATALDFKESKTSYMKAISQKLQAKYEFIFRNKILHFYNGEQIK